MSVRLGILKSATDETRRGPGRKGKSPAASAIAANGEVTRLTPCVTAARSGGKCPFASWKWPNTAKPPGRRASPLDYQAFDCKLKEPRWRKERTLDIFASQRISDSNGYLCSDYSSS